MRRQQVDDDVIAQAQCGQRPLRADAERNRQRILQAAAEVFAERGVDVSLDDIAAHAGVGIGTVYRRFADKDALIDALFERKITRLAEVAERALTEPDPWVALVEMLEQVLALQSGDRGLRAVLEGNGDGRVRVTRARERIAPAMTAVVRRAHESGQLRADITAEDFPVLVHMVGSVAGWTHEADPGLWRRFLALLLDGLRNTTEPTSILPAPALSPEDLEMVMSGAHRRRGQS